jgi:adenylosuccinate synthase
MLKKKKNKNKEGIKKKEEENEDEEEEEEKEKASGTQNRGIEPGLSHRICRAIKSTACLSSEGNYSRLSHVANLRYVKESCHLCGSRNRRPN